MRRRIEQLFQQQKAFVGYLTMGDGGIEHSLTAARALIAGGITLLELGVPFSDPIADGEVISRASQRALASHTTLSDVLEVAKRLRQETQIPLLLFSYFNPLLRANPTHWLPLAQQAGIDAILVVDLPYEEGQQFYAQCLAQRILPITVVTPATTSGRLKKLLRHAHGFIYYASRKGTTGMRAMLPEDFAEKVTLIKQHTTLPVVAGFGIANAQDARAVLQHADGFVVGSLFVDALARGMSMADLTQLARGLCEGRGIEEIKIN